MYVYEYSCKHILLLICKTHTSCSIVIMTLSAAKETRVWESPRSDDTLSLTSSSHLYVYICTLQDSYFSSLVLSKLEEVFQEILASSQEKVCEKIDPKTLGNFLRTTLQYSHKPSEIEEAIWEIDEDHDGKICWQEFQAACIRCIFDDQAREPQQMFNYILYTIFSHTTPILIESKLRHLLYLRYGKELAAEKLEKGFGSLGPYDVTLSQFIRGMSKI